MRGKKVRGSPVSTGAGGAPGVGAGSPLQPVETPWRGRYALVHTGERLLILPLFLIVQIYANWQ